jgi:phage FluMu protein gp41
VPTYTGKFKKGMKVGSKGPFMDFELREMTTEDMLDAELEFPPSKFMNYRAALAARQLVRVGDFEGPFTTAMIKKGLNPVDFDILISALDEVAKLGEDSSPSSKTD